MKDFAEAFEAGNKLAEHLEKYKKPEGLIRPNTNAWVIDKEHEHYGVMGRVKNVSDERVRLELIGPGTVEEFRHDQLKQREYKPGDYVCIISEDDSVSPCWGTIQNVYIASNAPLSIKLNAGVTIVDREEHEVELVTPIEDRYDDRMVLTKENYIEVAQWCDARITRPWSSPALHVRTGFGDDPNFYATVELGDAIEYAGCGRWQIWISGKRHMPQMENRSAELKKFRTDDPTEKARRLVHQLFLQREIRVPFEDVYIVWFCATLQNWKALVSTNVKDNAYYEVTHNGQKGETYVDRYLKDVNATVNDETGVTDMLKIDNFQL